MAAVAKDLEKVFYWMSSRNFNLNLAKVKAMTVSRKKHPPQPDIKLQSKTIQHVDSFKLLGVTISSDLSWNPHITAVASKAKRLLGFLYRMLRDSSRNCLSRLYEVVVLPNLDYCSCAWDPSHIKLLENMQTFAAKIPTNGWSRDF